MSNMTNKVNVRVGVNDHKIFKWLFGTVWTLSGGLGGKHKASVAMTVWQKQRCILVLEPNATLIFSLANLQLSLHSLFASQSSLLLSVTLQFFPTSHANPKSAAFSKEKKCVKTQLAGQRYPRGVTLLPVTTTKLRFTSEGRQ